MTLLTINKPTRPGLSKNRMFDTFPGVFDDFFNTLGEGFTSYTPAVNVSEKENSFEVELSAPGFNKEDIKVEMENGVLTISGENKTENVKEEKNYSRKEFSYGSFKRTFTVPEMIDEENVQAKYENGILKLSLAKRKELKENPVKQIKVS